MSDLASLEAAVDDCDFDVDADSIEYSDDRQRGRFIAETGDVDADHLLDVLDDHGFELVATIPAATITQVDVTPADE